MEPSHDCCVCSICLSELQPDPGNDTMISDIEKKYISVSEFMVAVRNKGPEMVPDNEVAHVQIYMAPSDEDCETKCTEIVKPYQIVETHCHHLFHVECMTEYAHFRQKSVKRGTLPNITLDCPVCRAKLVDDLDIYLEPEPGPGAERRLDISIHVPPPRYHKCTKFRLSVFLVTMLLCTGVLIFLLTRDTTNTNENEQKT